MLIRLSDWGANNLTTFEPSKMSFMVVSRKLIPFHWLTVSSLGIVFEGCPVGQAMCTKVVGYQFDSKLTWGYMIDDRARKARCRVGAIRRLASFLDSSNLCLMYTAFIRPVLEYGSLLYLWGLFECTVACSIYGDSVNAR